MMTIATGVQAVAEANYGRTEEALWYMGRIVETFSRVTPGSISEMMPDFGCFTIAWTSYGIVVPLIQHVFGIQPDATQKTVVFASSHARRLGTTCASRIWPSGPTWSRSPGPGPVRVWSTPSNPETADGRSC